jgi:hypothetical protein
VRHLYSCRFLPIGQTVNVPTMDGSPWFTEFHARSFEPESTWAKQPDVCVDHDRDCVVGSVSSLYTYDRWWCAYFTLDPVLPNELEVGQPMSVGLELLGAGDGTPFLREISIVRHGAVKGAEITRRVALKPTPAPKPPPTPPPEPARTEVIHHPQQPVIHRRAPVSARHAAEDAEMRRRLEWLEQHTGRYDLEAVVLGMQRELQGPSIFDLARASGLRVA